MFRVPEMHLLCRGAGSRIRRSPGTVEVLRNCGLRPQRPFEHQGFCIFLGREVIGVYRDGVNMKTRLNTGFDAIDGCFSRLALCLLWFLWFWGRSIWKPLFVWVCCAHFFCWRFCFVFSVYIYHFPTLGMRPSNHWKHSHKKTTWKTHSRDII